MRVLVFAVLAAFQCGLVCADEEGLIFYAPFDDFKVDAAVAKGSPKSSFTDSIELRNYPGVKGGALMLNESERCEYDLEGNINPQRGTISFWTKPVNWDGNDRLFHHFVCISDKETPSVWYIYKYASNNNLLFYIAAGRGKQQKKLYCGASVSLWKRGRWHHVAVTWDANEMRLYIDGKPAGKQLVVPGVLPERMRGTLSLVPVQYWKNPQWTSPEERTLIDEVKIFDRALSYPEVVEMFEKLDPYAKEGARKPSLMVLLKPNVAGRRLLISITAMHLDDFWRRALHEGAPMAVSVTTPAGKTRKTLPFSREVSLDEDVNDWKAGDYTVEAAVTREGKALEGQARLHKPPTPWLQKKPGAEFLDKVLPPWTPLKCKKGAVECWGRKIIMGKGPFPVGLRSQGRELLRSPILLRGKIGGVEFTADGETKPTGQTDCRVKFEGTQDVRGARLTWKTTIEFDGMIRADFALEPRGKVDVESLRIEIPMTPEFIRYIRTPKRKEWTDDRFESPFLNYVWVGDESRGLCWFMESDANFHVTSDTDVVKVSKKTGLASLTIINDPVSTDRKLSYTAGFQATPLKPLPKDWQAWRLGNTKFKGCNMMTHGWGPRCYTLAGSLVPLDVKRHMESLKKWHDMGIKIYSYTCTGCAADLFDEWPFFEAEWSCAYGSTFPGYKRWPDQTQYSLRSVCAGSSCADFLVYRVENLMKNGWADGIYTDIDGPTPCDNHLHGCGYVDAFGRRGRSVPIFKHRELSKRIYGICHAHGGKYLSHSHNNFIAPYHAFIDGWCPGEQNSIAVIGNHTFYMDGLKADDWRAEYYSPVTGVVTFMLAQWGRMSPKEDKEIRFPTENLVAMTALYDVPLWAGFTNLDVVNEYWQAQIDFGFEDVEFFPYWEDPPVTSPTSDVKVSVYGKGRRMLAAVVNFSRADKEVELVLDERAKACAVVLPKGVAISGGGAKWRLPVRGKNFALVRIEY